MAQVGSLIATDPTRVIQGIVTGIGFLGSGVIMREGFNISGLTTAASIWASSAIGVMIGVGFYMGAMGLAFLCSMSMIYLSKLEAWLPSRHAVAMTMRFKAGYVPNEAALREIALRRTAEHVGDDVRSYRQQLVQTARQQNATDQPAWNTSGALLVCVGPHAGAEHAVRSAA
eukprot:gene18973-23248_t